MDKTMKAAEFNAHYPVGTPVRYFPVLPAGDDFPPRDTRTRTPAWDLSDGRPLVSVEGQAGGVSLTHIEIREIDTEVAP